MDTYAPPDGEVARLGSAADGIGMPVAFFLLGRGRTGKTTVANAVIQFCRKRGARLEVWNSDRQTDSHSLNLFHTDAMRPASDDPEEKRLWAEANFGRQVRERFDAVMDIAGGDPMVRNLGREYGLVRVMQRRGVRAVAAHVLGTAPADLDYLRKSMEDDGFSPEATLLVLNCGLVSGGRAPETVFAEIVNHEVVLAAQDRGAQIVYFPRLLCMPKLVAQGLSFAEAADGVMRPGHDPLDMSDEARVQVFWDRDLPEFMASIAREWLPAMPGWVA